MSKFRWNNSKISLMDATTPTTVQLALECAMKSGGLEQKREEIEVTTICSDGKQYIGGAVEGTFKVTIYQESGTYSSSVQKVFRDIWGTAQPRKFRIREQGDAVGKPETTFDAVITSISEPIEIGDAVSVEMDMRVSGTVTYGTQAS